MDCLKVLFCNIDKLPLDRVQFGLSFTYFCCFFTVSKFFILMSFQVELLILSHHFYMSSSCLDGVDVLVTFAANRVDSYVSEGDFSCLARLITGVSNFHSLSFILSILIENGQLELLLQKYSATDTATGTPASVRGFRMAVITSLKHFNQNDDEALSMVSLSLSEFRNLSM